MKYSYYYYYSLLNLFIKQVESTITTSKLPKTSQFKPTSKVSIVINYNGYNSYGYISGYNPSVGSPFLGGSYNRGSTVLIIIIMVINNGY